MRIAHATISHIFQGQDFLLNRFGKIYKNKVTLVVQIVLTAFIDFHKRPFQIKKGITPIQLRARVFTTGTPWARFSIVPQ